MEPMPSPKLRRLALFLALCSFVGCWSASSPRAADIDYDRDHRMFADGLDNIDRHYVRKVDLGNIAASGLVAITKIDQGLSIRVGGGELDLMYHGQSAGSFAITDRLGPEGWAVLMAETLTAARRVSTEFRSADSELAYTVIFDAMLASLDPPFSRYAGRDQATQDRATRQGYVGIGVHISIDGGVPRITSVIPNTPAERIGLQAEDVITAIDGNSTQGLDQQAVVELLRGAAGSRVTLAIRKSGAGEPLTMTVTRENVAPPTVNYQRQGDIANFRIYQFGEGTAASLRRGVENAVSSMGGEMRGVILDLRDDPGGLLDQGVAVADLFMNGGRIVSIRGRDPNDVEAFDATAGDIAHGLPIAVLINASTASASEIVSAALQDSGRAVVIGSNSYGKGTVQAVHPMPNGGELILTTARFYAPSGYTLNHLGVLPAICTNHSGEGATALLAELAGGQLPRLPIARRESISPDDTAGQDQLRGGCPAYRGTNPVDLDLASQLLARPELFTKALRLADPRATAPE